MFSRTSTMRYTENYSDNIEKIRTAISEADAIVIGAGAGLSTSAGFTYSGERLEKYFGDFVRDYQIPDMYSGGFMMMQQSPEVFWAYWSRYIYINRYMDPPKPVYKNLYCLVKDKDYFVITTNVDHCFQKVGFDKNRLFYTQGDYGLWQCSEPCHNKTYDNEESVRKMLTYQGYTFDEDDTLVIPEGVTPKMKISPELIPHCPVCGKPMMMNLRADDRFVQDEGWERAANNYSDFIGKCEKKMTLFLELGVGGNTPVIIKYPFWRITQKNPDAIYACINYGEAACPKEIDDRSICINGDIGELLKKIDINKNGSCS